MRDAKKFQKELGLLDEELGAFQSFLDDPNQKEYILKGPKIMIVSKTENNGIRSLGYMTDEEFAEIREWIGL